MREEVAACRRGPIIEAALIATITGQPCEWVVVQGSASRARDQDRITVRRFEEAALRRGVLLTNAGGHVTAHRVAWRRIKQRVR